jgi:hypothetical protein
MTHVIERAEPDHSIKSIEIPKTIIVEIRYIITVR